MEYRNVVKQMNESEISDKEKLNEECASKLMEFLNEKCFKNIYQFSNFKAVIMDLFSLQNEQIKLIKSQKFTKQNISPSAYEMLKSDFEQISI
jgi:hypothetical protein